MKLYLISQNSNPGYDTYDSAVVAAENEEIARNMSPSSGLPIEWGDMGAFFSWCSSADDVMVEYLGEAVEGTEQGVICASFNAG